MVIACPNRRCRGFVRVPTGEQVKATCPRCEMGFNFGPVLIGACPRCGTMEFEQVQWAGGPIQDVCRACRWPEQTPEPVPQESTEVAARPRAGGLSPTISLGLVGVASALALVGVLGGESPAAQGALLLLIIVGPLALLALWFTRWTAAVPMEATVQESAPGEEVLESEEGGPAVASDEEEMERRRSFLEFLYREAFEQLSPAAFSALVTEIFRLHGGEVLRDAGAADGTGDAVLRDAQGPFVVRCILAAGPVGEAPFQELHHVMTEQGARGTVVTTGDISAEAYRWTTGKGIAVIGRDGLGRLAREAFSEAYVFGPDFRMPCELPPAPVETASETADSAPPQRMPAAA